LSWLERGGRAPRLQGGPKPGPTPISGVASHRLHIDDIAFGGRGVGRLADGRVAFVPFVLAGETVEVEIVRERRHHVEARLLWAGEPSPHRVAAPCPYFGRCGGCSYQHMDAGEQLRVKRSQVEQAVRRIGRCDGVAVEPVVPSPQVYGYRNRITVHFDEQSAGFFGHGGREIVDVAQCLIAGPEVNAALAHFRAGKRPRNGHCTLRMNPARRTFQQTNDGAAAELLRLVSALAGAGGKRLIDAYCGAGFFLKHLRGRFEEVVGLEWDRWAVAEAQSDAAPNERYLCGDVAENLARELTPDVAAGTLVICDPPAEGLSERVRDVLGQTRPGNIIYVSCDPATLARDIGALAKYYSPLSIQPLDMFPQTAQIEVVAHLGSLLNYPDGSVTRGPAAR
jgi:tRNA/tmRNA/rRNA uracil-C5-methylase (TrmA/RlmC/RlmD family)